MYVCHSLLLWETVYLACWGEIVVLFELDLSLCVLCYWWIAGDIVLLEDPEFSALVKEYAADNTKFLADFKAAWTKVMNADRFKGPTGSVCEE